MTTSRWLDATASRSGFVRECFEACGDRIPGAKKRRLDYVAQDMIRYVKYIKYIYVFTYYFSDLDSVVEQVTTKDTNMKIKQVVDPLLPDMVTGVSVCLIISRNNRS